MQDSMHTVVSFGLVMLIVVALARIVLDVLEGRRKHSVRTLAHAGVGTMGGTMRMPRTPPPRRSSERSHGVPGGAQPAPAPQPPPGGGTYRVRYGAAEKVLPEDHPYAPGNDFVRLARPAKAEPNYYALLGVGPLASTEDLERAFRQRVMEMHPDHHFNDPARYKEGIEELKELNAAMVVLRDPYARLQYDIRRGDAGPSPGLRARMRGR